MRISSAWLSEYVTLPPNDELETVFEMAGIGVEHREGDNWTLEVTSNRGDWLSATGLAREIAAMTGAPFRPGTRRPHEIPPAGDGFIAVEIEEPLDCPRYAARGIEGIKVGPSPAWLQQRLTAAGMRPVNNVVDVTNFVMLDRGQPLHAFDADRLGGEKIAVRRARSGETILTLDGVQRELSPEVLLITDGSRPLACAGIMGGQESEVSSTTTRIVLESAHFSPLVVRRGARYLELNSEASRRFERWVDPNGVDSAAEFAAQLLFECGGASSHGSTTDRYPQPIGDAEVALRVARCNALLGLQLASEEIARALVRLGLVVRGNDGETLRVAIPTWRRDIEREIDLIEEVARIHGYQRIPTTLPHGINETAGRSLGQRLEERAKNALLICGHTEVTTYSLQSAAAVERAGLPVPRRAEDAPFPLRNALSEDFTQLRTSLLPSLLEVMARNCRRRLRIFELGRVYRRAGENAQPAEPRTIGIAMLDAPATPHWQSSPERNDFFALKATVEQLLDGLGAPRAVFRAIKEAPFHPGRCACVSIDDRDIGILGEVHPDVSERYQLAGRAYLATIDFEALVRHVGLAPVYAPLSRFPSADRDMALVLTEQISAAQVKELLMRVGAPLLKRVAVFDLYSGPPIPAGHKSLALALCFRAADRTLNDPEIDEAMERLLSAAKNELRAQIRS